MAAIKNVDSEFFSQSPCPMRAFTSDKSIHPFCCGLSNTAACASSDNADIFTNFGASSQ